MVPLPYSWPRLIPFWAAFAWAAFGELPIAIRDNRTPTAPTDRGSKVLIQTVTAISAVLAFIAAARLPQFSITALRVPVYLAGVASLLAGASLRRHCFRMLGERFTFDVRVSPNQQIVQRGAYGYVRHPSYSAGLLVLAGIGLALGNWLSLAITVALPLPTYAYRITVEERTLVAVLGPAYTEYMRRTRRLIPFVL